MKPVTKFISDWLKENGIKADVYCLYYSTTRAVKVEQAYTNCSRTSIPQVDFEGCVIGCDYSTYKLRDLPESKLERTLSALNEALEIGMSVEERELLEKEKAILRNKLWTIKTTTPFALAQKSAQEYAAREYARENRELIDKQKDIKERTEQMKKERWKKKFQ